MASTEGRIVGLGDHDTGRNTPLDSSPIPFDVIAVRNRHDADDDGFLYPLADEDLSSAAAEAEDGFSQWTVAKGVVVEEISPRRSRVARLSDVSITLTVTNSRVTLACRKYDKGGGWLGFGGEGAAVAVIANAFSHAAAAYRRSGRLMVGHVRYPWLSAVACRRPKGITGGDTIRLGLTDALTGPPRSLLVTLTLPKGVDGPKVAGEIISRALADRRHRHLDEGTTARLAALQANPPQLDTRGPEFAVVELPGSTPVTRRPDGCADSPPSSRTNEGPHE